MIFIPEKQIKSHKIIRKRIKRYDLLTKLCKSGFIKKIVIEQAGDKITSCLINVDITVNC